MKHRDPYAEGWDNAYAYLTKKMDAIVECPYEKGRKAKAYLDGMEDCTAMLSNSVQDDMARALTRPPEYFTQH